MIRDPQRRCQTIACLAITGSVCFWVSLFQGFVIVWLGKRLQILMGVSSLFHFVGHSHRQYPTKAQA